MIILGALSALAVSDALFNGRLPSVRSFKGTGGRLRLSTSDSGEDGVSLSVLDNVKGDGDWLASQIQLWLDTEWIKQPVHEKIGRSVSEIYVKGRMAETQDLTDMLMEIGTGLEAVSFDDPEGDAYVNAWDVANKASDLLMLRLDRKLCDCMGDMSIFDNSQSTGAAGADGNNLMEVATSLSQPFDRYKWMGDFLDGDEDDVIVKAVLALVLGFRPDRTKEGAVIFDSDVGAYGWQELCEGNRIPDLLDPGDEAMARRLEADLPEDAEVTDIAVEPLVGLEMYRQMTNPDIASAEEKHRVLLAKWLYVHNFMTADCFPAVEVFVPVNLQEDEDEEEEEDKDVEED